MTWTIAIPTEPTLRLVLVKNIAAKTEGETIQDFLSFCGVIEAFEITTDGEHQTALVVFEEASAANTAILLSGAVIDDNPIQVEPYFKSISTDIPDDTALTDVTTEISHNKVPKSVSHVMSELLASGYVLTDNVLKKGVEFDGRYNVSTRVNGYLNKIGVGLHHLNQKISKSPHNTVDVIADQNRQESQHRSAKKHNLFQSKAGSKVHSIASRMVEKVNMIHEDAKRIAVK
ncbi:hypothetical protein BDB01DRAFT_717820 [Pilobolus umbonatus]|nr:hypothetical protein BDB01DRAFT_717820 [Pilobolus umbonatus]